MAALSLQKPPPCARGIQNVALTVGTVCEQELPALWQLILLLHVTCGSAVMGGPSRRQEAGPDCCRRDLGSTQLGRNRIFALPPPVTEDLEQIYKEGVIKHLEVSGNQDKMQQETG